jgi:hypothetical protein
MVFSHVILDRHLKVGRNFGEGVSSRADVPIYILTAKGPNKLPQSIRGTIDGDWVS